MQLQGSIRVQTCKVIEIQALDLKGQDLPRMSSRLVIHRILQMLLFVTVPRSPRCQLHVLEDKPPWVLQVLTPWQNVE